jgi:hypothetical protein
MSKKYGVAGRRPVFSRMGWPRHCPCNTILFTHLHISRARKIHRHFQKRRTRATCHSASELTDHDHVNQFYSEDGTRIYPQRLLSGLKKAINVLSPKIQWPTNLHTSEKQRSVELRMRMRLSALRSTKRRSLRCARAHTARAQVSGARAKSEHRTIPFAR